MNDKILYKRKFNESVYDGRDSGKVELILTDFTVLSANEFKDHTIVEKENINKNIGLYNADVIYKLLKVCKKLYKDTPLDVKKWSIVDNGHIVSSINVDNNEVEFYHIFFMLRSTYFASKQETHRLLY